MGYIKLFARRPSSDHNTSYFKIKLINIYLYDVVHDEASDEVEDVSVVEEEEEGEDHDGMGVRGGEVANDGVDVHPVEVEANEVAVVASIHYVVIHGVVVVVPTHLPPQCCSHRCLVVLFTV